MAERIAVVSVLYPAALPFWPEVMADLNAQSDPDFLLVVVLDGVAPGQLASARMPSLEIPATGTPGSLRQRVIAAAAERADILVFADADDRFQTDRVAAIRQAMTGWDALGHDFIPFRAGAADQPPALHGGWEPDRAFTAADLVDGTCIGLSTSACRAPLARTISTRLDPSAELFDWDFYATLLHQGGAVRYLDRPLTRYRQHAGNLAGWGRSADPARGCRLKAAHYRRLQACDPRFGGRAAAFTTLAERLRSDPHFRTIYDQRPSPPRPGWWYDLIIPEEIPPCAS